jgi:hypothetical protein
LAHGIAPSSPSPSNTQPDQWRQKKQHPGGLERRKLKARITGKHTLAMRENLCRAFSIGRTAKSFFAVRFIKGRQRENAQ